VPVASKSLLRLDDSTQFYERVALLKRLLQQPGPRTRERARCVVRDILRAHIAKDAWHAIDITEGERQRIRACIARDAVGDELFDGPFAKCHCELQFKLRAFVQSAEFGEAAAVAARESVGLFVPNDL
jgi:hypothetical protein